MINTPISRRKLLEMAALTAVGAALLPAGGAVAGRQALPLITKPIPSSGEALPVIGVGSNQFGTDEPETLARIRAVLEQLPKLGGNVVDTAQAYGNSEAVIGRLVKDIGNHNSLFIATKTAARGGVSVADIDGAFERLRTERIDLMQVHNFNATDEVLPKLLALKSDGRIRYVGCSTSSDGQYAQMKSAIAKYPLDFIQVDYSIDNRTAAGEMLPMAADNGIAVLGNLPFGGRRNAASTFARVSQVDLPDWAAEIDVTSWAQFFLKYVVSHPAVTVSIPGTTKPHHLEDNLGAARGRLPDAHMRREMERYWDEI
jgi:aryl-alcohol dehydrogenase-like predicted oxidoreductase